MRSTRLSFALCAALSLAACGDDESSSTGEGGTSSIASGPSTGPGSGQPTSSTSDTATGPGSGGGGTGGGGGDAGTGGTGGTGGAGGGVDWTIAHCETHECYFVMQNVEGASDVDCNGRSPVDLGTTDDEGLRDCPFAGFSSTRLYLLMNPNGDGELNRGRWFFIGEGSYQPHVPLALRGDGTTPDEAVVLTNYRGQEATIDGSECPESCEIQTDDGPVTLTPCCYLPCDSCDADPSCIELPFAEGCGAPWDKPSNLLAISGSYVRVEGLHLAGCGIDNIDVGWRTEGDPPVLVPNDGVFIANNTIDGCDVNENVKGLGSGPGPFDGGPAWGPTHVIGNRMRFMASQAVDATGVHGWLIEDNLLLDAKTGDGGPISYDGGGIGFKNGSSLDTVRNNWARNGGGFGFGGVSGSCEFATSPPTDWGCFQTYEAQAMVGENNTMLGATDHGVQLYHCRDCQILGNVLTAGDEDVLVRISDDCTGDPDAPGPACPSFNPELIPSNDVRFERNYFPSTRWDGGPYAFLYLTVAHPDGLAAHDFSSTSNTFCAPSGFAPESDDPEGDLELFARRYTMDPDDVPEIFALDPFRSDIGDVGSRMYNAPGASTAACPLPAECSLALDPELASVEAAGPATCDACLCTVALDGAETSVACNEVVALSEAMRAPGRHYVSLRVDTPAGGASCGISYGVKQPIVGAACQVSTSGDTIAWQSSGNRCSLHADDDVELGEVDCSGTLALPAALKVAGRHQIRLAVGDTPDGQTTCSTVIQRP